MARWHLRLHHRIVIPFVLVALLTVSAAAIVVVRVVSRTFESRVGAQVVNTANVVSVGGFAVNASVLRSVKAISGADVVTFTRDGTILANTFEPARGDLVALVTRSPAALNAFGANTASLVREPGCETPCYVAYRLVSGRADTVVAVVAETSEVVAATSAVARGTLLTALASLVALVLVSQVVARRVTAPLERLVDFAHGAGERSPGRAAEGTDEVGRLGRAFNEMLDRLDQSQQKLVRSEKLALAGLLAARVAHDIRNPLSSIKMQTQMLQARLRDENARPLITAVLHDVGQVESVIRDLIELARPGELHLQQVALNDLVSDVLAQLEARLAHRKIAVEAHLATGLPIVAIDVERFRQAVLNVIFNATDAMPNGGLLTVSTTAGNGSTIVLDVCDDGTGIDEALRDRVFDPFVSSKPGGVGLGLVNVKAVVELHGGSITLQPRQPRGTRASIVLPVSANA
jgi:signal transduction histidine kinase